MVGVFDVGVARVTDGGVVGYVFVFLVDCKEGPVSVVDVDEHEE